MKRVDFLFLAAGLALTAAAATPAWAAFDTERPGARPAGMAGAFAAIVDDADALLYNPAGLPQIGRTTLAANYGRLLTGLNEDSLGESRLAFLQPIPSAGTLGVAWDNRNWAGVYQEDALTLAYGQYLDAQRSFSVGASLRLLRSDYLDAESIWNNPYFDDGTAAMGVGFDVGALVRLPNGFSAGLALANIGQPDLSLHHGGGIVPLRIRAGAGYRIGGDVTVDVDYLRYGLNSRVATGGEAWWLDHLFGTRLGLGMDDGVTELTAGLSILLRQEKWSLQFDYAFAASGGEFAGAGPSHLLNLTLAFSMANPERTKGLKLKAEGQSLVDQGQLSAALEIWEQAKDLLPEDAELDQKLENLQAELNRRSEIDLYLREGEEFQKNGNYRGAAEAYRKVLKLDPQHAQAALQFQAMQDKIKLVNQTQALQKQERAAAERLRQASLRAADEALQSARYALDRARKSDEMKRLYETQLKQLGQQLAAAEALRRDEEGERAQVVAQAVSAGLERLQRRHARQQAETQAVKAAAGREEGTTSEPAPRPTAIPPTPTAQSTPKPTAEDEALRRQARGAYGRAVKLMLDIDQQQGRKHFPDEYATLQAEAARIKSLLTGEEYTAVIRAAQALYPRLEKMKTQCQRKNKVSEAMPTNW